MFTAALYSGTPTLLACKSSALLLEYSHILIRFHLHRDVFIDAGVRVDISLPRQHALVHYRRLIELFGSPNGVCSSITESKHIVAVKKPWRCSSRYNALSQMLRRISREEKLDAARCEFTKQGMMDGSVFSYTAMIIGGGEPKPPEVEEDEEELEGEDDDLGPSSGPKVLSSISLSRNAGEPLYSSKLVYLLTIFSRTSIWLSCRTRRTFSSHKSTTST